MQKTNSAKAPSPRSLSKRTESFSHLIETGQVQEKTMSLDDLLTAETLYLGNSLRGLIPAALIDTTLR